MIKQRDAPPRNCQLKAADESGYCSRHGQEQLEFKMAHVGSWIYRKHKDIWDQILREIDASKKK